MAPNNKRREATRRQLERQLHERQEREARRKRAVLIGSVVSTIVVVALVVVLVVVLASGGSNNKKSQAAAKTTAPAPTTSAATSTSPSAAPTDTPCKVTHPKGSVLFDKVTIANPRDLAKTPDVSSCSKQVPKTLAYKDLVVGKGAKATTKSTVSVQYEGVFYSDGYQFNSSWRDNGGKPTSFPLAPGQVIDGFSLGIAGSSTVPAMRVGGRRVIVLPASLAYKAAGTSDGSIPGNTPLVFVVDLKSVTPTK